MQRDPDELSTAFSDFDALLPKDMAERAERAGAEKAEQGAPRLLALSTLAGAYIAFGATFAAAVSAGFSAGMPVGLGKLVGGLAFSLAYVLAIGGGVLVALVYWFVYLRLEWG